MLRPTDYTIGWVCGDLHDFDAVGILLDERHDHQDFVSSDDDNSYVFGRMRWHNVIVVLPTLDGSVSRAVANMVQTFQNIKFYLLVGTGGGVPSDGNDIRLGDVVVGVSNSFGGLLQYDMKYSGQEQTLHATAHQIQSPSVLLNAITLPEDYDGLSGRKIVDMITESISGKPEERELWHVFRRPHSDSDRLYRTSLIHNPRHQDCEVGCGDDPSLLIVRDARPEGSDPAIHYGTIASSTEWMWDASLRDKIGPQNNILCFETAAAGLMNYLPCLVVRGISNYADSHEPWDWEPYAAMNAAAYTKKLLYDINVRDVSMADEIPKFMIPRFSQPSAYNNISRVLRYRGKVSRTDLANDSNSSNLPSIVETPDYPTVTDSRTEVAQQQQPRKPGHSVQGGGQPARQDAVADELFMHSINKSSAISSRLLATPINTYITRFIFHQSTLLAVLLLIGAGSAMMILAAVKQTREPACTPSSKTLGSDDGFWVLLAQLFLQILAIFCTVYPVVLNRDLKDSVATFWFVALLVVSFLATITSLAVYAWSWKAATILGFVAAFAQVMSAGQLAISLDPRNAEKKVMRRTTFKIENGHQD